MATPPPQRRTLGFLVRRLETDNSFTSQIWKRIFDLCQAEGTNLLLVRGRAPILDQKEGVADTAIYRLITKAFIDGAFLTGPVLDYLGPERDRFAQEWPPHLPVVSFTRKVGGFPCLYVDDRVGMRALVQHLLHVHRYKKIVYVRGPQTSVSAHIRESVWREELEKAGIEPGQDWLIEGHYEPNSVPEITKILMAQTGGVFDAVVAANDRLAIQIIKDLQAMGFRIPQDYGVCGFDDIGPCQVVTPSLTTVSQFAPQQVESAWNMLNHWIDTDAPPEDRVIDTALMVRASCGCGPEQESPGAFRESQQRVEELLNSIRAKGTEANLHHSLMTILEAQENHRRRSHEKDHIISQFIRALNKIDGFEALGAELDYWLPLLGFEQFALFLTCDLQGNPTQSPVSAGEEELLPYPPSCFRALVTYPERGLETPLVLNPNNIAHHPWFQACQPFVLGAFPLAVDGNWYGLAFLQLGRDIGLQQHIIQEQLVSVLDRIYREKTAIDRNTEERIRTTLEKERNELLTRLVSGVAHEMNTPLAAIASCNSSILHACQFLTTDSLDFFQGLTPEGQSLYVRLMSQFPRVPSLTDRVLNRQKQRLWTEMLTKASCLHPSELSEELMDLGYPEEDSLSDLTAIPHWESIVHQIYQWAVLFRSTHVISTATGKAAEFVTTLRKTRDYHPPGSSG